MLNEVNLKPRERKRILWYGLLREFELGGYKSQKEFCQRFHLSGSTLRIWRRRLLGEGTCGVSSASPSRSDDAASVPASHPGFVPVQLAALDAGRTESSPPMRVELPDGTALEVPASIAPSMLRELVAALR